MGDLRLRVVVEVSPRSAAGQSRRSDYVTGASASTPTTGTAGRDGRLRVEPSAGSATNRVRNPHSPLPSAPPSNR